MSGAATATRFTSYRETHYRGFLIGIGLVMVVEVVGVHVLLTIFASQLWAWIATGLGVYSAWWMWADWQGLQRHPTLLQGDRLAIRLGTRWQGELPLNHLESARRIDPFTAVPGGDRPQGVFQLRLLGEPNVELRFDPAVEFRGPFGIRKRTHAVRMQIDDVDRFVEALQ